MLRVFDGEPSQSTQIGMANGHDTNKQTPRLQLNTLDNQETPYRLFIIFIITTVYYRLRVTREIIKWFLSSILKLHKHKIYLMAHSLNISTPPMKTLAPNTQPDRIHRRRSDRHSCAGISGMISTHEYRCLFET